MISATSISMTLPIRRQLTPRPWRPRPNAHPDHRMTVVFSTYQSIQTISDAQKKFGLPEFDLIICDIRRTERRARNSMEQENPVHQGPRQPVWLDFVYCIAASYRSHAIKWPLEINYSDRYI